MIYTYIKFVWFLTLLLYIYNFRIFYHIYIFYRKFFVLYKNGAYYLAYGEVN